MNPLDLRWQMLRDRWPIRFKNPTGEEIPPYAVMKVSNWTESDNEILCSVSKPDTTFQRRYLVNGPFAVGTGSDNEGVASFLGRGGPVYISGTPTDNEEWGATSGQWYLSQHRPGFIISGSNTETHNGKTIALAIQFVAQVVYGKADAAIAKNASGTVRVYGGAFGSESDTSMTISSCYNKTSDIADEAEVTVCWPNGKPLVANLVCT